MPEPRLVPHPTHLGASPGSATGPGRALEHNVGDSVGPCCSGHALGSTNVHEKVAPVVQCVSSFAPHSGVNHLPTSWPALHQTVHEQPVLLGPAACLSRVQGSFLSFTCGCGAVYPLLIPASSKMQHICSLYIFHEVENFVEK